MQMTPNPATSTAAPCRRLVALAATASAIACAPASAPPPPAPAAPPVSAPVISQRCPDPSDGPSIVVNAVEDAHRALAANPSTPLPPVCVLTAYAQITSVLPDSLDAHALVIAAELDRRGSGKATLLESEIPILARAGRYADVLQAYARLAALDPHPPIAIARLAIAAAHQRADTAALLKLLSATASRADSPPVIRAEYNVLRQTSALRSAIAEARGLVRQNPRYAAAYPSLVGNFGTLGMTDSVISYTRRGLTAGASRASLAPALEPYVSALLRHASLYGGTYDWAEQITSASSVDATLSTPSTKFLVAALIVSRAEPRVPELSARIVGTPWLPRSMGAGATDAAARERAAGCRELTALSGQLNDAKARLQAGGDKYAGGGVPQVAAGISGAQERVAGLQEVCTRAGGAAPQG